MVEIAPDKLQKLLNGPALVAPPGVQHNFANPSNSNKNYYVNISLCLAIASLAVLMRLWTTIFLIRKVRMEDGKPSPSRFMRENMNWHFSVLTLLSLVRGLRRTFAPVLTVQRFFLGRIVSPLWLWWKKGSWVCICGTWGSSLFRKFYTYAVQLWNLFAGRTKLMRLYCSMYTSRRHSIVPQYWPSKLPSYFSIWGFLRQPAGETFSSGDATSWYGWTLSIT